MIHELSDGKAQRSFLTGRGVDQSHPFSIHIRAKARFTQTGNPFCRPPGAKAKFAVTFGARSYDDPVRSMPKCIFDESGRQLARA